jgi:hypothetical protein
MEIDDGEYGDNQTDTSMRVTKGQADRMRYWGLQASARTGQRLTMSDVLEAALEALGIVNDPRYRIVFSDQHE